MALPGTLYGRPIVWTKSSESGNEFDIVLGALDDYTDAKSTLRKVADITHADGRPVDESRGTIYVIGANKKQGRFETVKSALDFINAECDGVASAYMVPIKEECEL